MINNDRHKFWTHRQSHTCDRKYCCACICVRVSVCVHLRTFWVEDDCSDVSRMHDKPSFKWSVSSTVHSYSKVWKRRGVKRGGGEKCEGKGRGGAEIRGRRSVIRKGGEEWRSGEAGSEENKGDEIYRRIRRQFVCLWMYEEAIR